MSTSNPIRKLGYEHYECYPNDGKRHEIIDGDHYMNPAPSTFHQTVSKRLQHQLYTKVELAGRGVAFNAPVDVQLTDHDIVQPDLVVLLNEKRSLITLAKINGVPDQIVEIISPSNPDYDRKLKRRLYERTGVREYWIVDPTEFELEQLVLVDNRYHSSIAGEKFCLAINNSVSIDLAEVWKT